MTALYIKAALVVAISLAAFLIVTKIAWPSNVMLFKMFVAWCRTVPETLKRVRDPVYRRRQQRVDEYLAAFGGLYSLRIQRARLVVQRQEADGAGVIRFLDALIGDLDIRIDGMRLIAVELMRRLDDDSIEAIAERLNTETLGGRAPLVELRSFLAEERTVIVGAPHYAPEHINRLVRRFGAYASPAEPPP